MLLFLIAKAVRLVRIVDCRLLCIFFRVRPQIAPGVSAARRTDSGLKAHTPAQSLSRPHPQGNTDKGTRGCSHCLIQNVTNRNRCLTKNIAGDRLCKHGSFSTGRKRTQFDSDGYAWRSVQDRGQRLRNTHKPVCFRVSLGTYKRALSIVNTLALAAPERGFAVREDDQEGRIVFAGHDAEIKLRITEPLEQKTRPRNRYDGTIEQEKFQVPTGRLRMTLQIGRQEHPAFEDRESLSLESQLNRAFCAVYRLVVKAWRRERDSQAFHRRLEEEARQRAEAARLQAEREKAIAEERERRWRLSAEASRWAQSSRIRGYVEHIRKSAVGRLNTSAELNEWAQWALSVAAELDPTEERVNEDLNESPVDS
jgi:hypothetical protein